MKYKTILICGLPGAGKTHFANRLAQMLGDAAEHWNADEVRKAANDWDFSDDGRLRQLQRMKSLAAQTHSRERHAILDFVCPKQSYRDAIAADIIVWANRNPTRNFPDTLAAFEKPTEFDFMLTDSQTDAAVEVMGLEIMERLFFNPIEPTALMIGRFQFWHEGHTALFKAGLEKHGHVCIAIRTMRISKKNPFSPHEIRVQIDEALKDYAGKYHIVELPNIVDVIYGRDVGWTVSKIDLPAEIEAISATKKRESIATPFSEEKT